MHLIRIWSTSQGLVYDAVRDDPSVAPPAAPVPVEGPAVKEHGPVQLEFAF